MPNATIHPMNQETQPRFVGPDGFSGPEPRDTPAEMEFRRQERRSRFAERDLKLSILAGSIRDQLLDALVVASCGTARFDQIPQRLRDQAQEQAEAVVRRMVGGAEKSKALRLTAVHAMRWMKSSMIKQKAVAEANYGAVAGEAVGKALAGLLEDMFPVSGTSSLVDEILTAETYELRQPLRGEGGGL